MKIMALDTSTEACSAALMVEDQVYSRFEVAPRKHAELILPMIDDLLATTNTKLTDLDGIAFGRGPGAFTGVRIATGIAQGLAYSSNLPVIPISSLATLAQAYKDKAKYVAAAFDARMGEVYFGLYQTGDVVSLVEDEQVCKPEDLQFTIDGEFFGVGTGWATYGEILKNKLKNKLSDYHGDCYPDAKFMLPIAESELKNGNAIQPEQAAPVYLRDKVTG